jgi:hypothetical protein
MRHVVPLLLLLTACQREPEPVAGRDSDPVLADPSDKYLNMDEPTAQPEHHGPVIDVWSDSKAAYTDEGSGVLPNGNLWITTRRDGPSGVSFAKREIDCGAGMFRYLQEGDTLESMTDDAPSEMAPLTEGSISTLVSDYACRKHGRGAITGM